MTSNNNWYVIQVTSGMEENTLNQIKAIISEDILIDSFIPYIKVNKKYRGEWHVLNEVLFKGYVFLISDRIDDLFQELKRVPKYTKLLGLDKDKLYPLPDEEVEFIKTFTKDDYTIETSVGYIIGDKIVVTDGPLFGKEAMIKKIDRHKRIAYIDVEFFNQTISTKVGLEIIKKTV